MGPMFLLEPPRPFAEHLRICVCMEGEGVGTGRARGGSSLLRIAHFKAASVCLQWSWTSVKSKAGPGAPQVLSVP